MPGSSAAVSSPWREGFRSKYIFKKKTTETYMSVMCFQTRLHSAFKDAHKYWLWEPRFGNPENGQSENYKALPHFTAWWPHRFLSETPFCKGKGSWPWPEQTAGLLFSLRQITFKWSKQMTERQTRARAVQHGRNGLPSLRLPPRLLGFIIGIYIICKLRTFL